MPSISLIQGGSARVIEPLITGSPFSALTAFFSAALPSVSVFSPVNAALLSPAAPRIQIVLPPAVRLYQHAQLPL